MVLMYKYVDFYCDINLGHLFIIFILSNKCYKFSLLNETLRTLFCGNLIAFNTPL